LSTRTLAFILGAVLFSVAGQLSLKAGTQQLATLDARAFLMAATRNGYVVSGIAAWTISTVCWLFVLRAAPLSRAYGLTSLKYVLIFAAGVAFLGERVRPVHVVGTALIIIGIACLLAGD